MSRHGTNKSRVAKFAIAIVVMVGVWWFGNDLLLMLEGDRSSRSIGSVSNGTLADGVRLPSSGDNFVTYSRLGSLIGRTSVHSEVRDIVVDSYARLARDVPRQHWVYGETGWPWGGEFWPHRTHQNGLVVDFMVPLERDGKPVAFPHAPWHGFGYAVELDELGTMANGARIDFRAMATHLRVLEDTARERAYRIRRVIFAPKLRRQLLRSPKGPSIRGLSFNRNPVWVRHDDHYHVEFAPISSDPISPDRVIGELEQVEDRRVIGAATSSKAGLRDLVGAVDASKKPVISVACFGASSPEDPAAAMTLRQALQNDIGPEDPREPAIRQRSHLGLSDATRLGKLGGETTDVSSNRKAPSSAKR